MSKKKFTTRLDSIFSPEPNAVTGRGTAFLRNPFEPGDGKGEKASKPNKRSSRKDFTTDLDSLLEEALQESFDEQIEASASSDSKAQDFHQQAPRKRPFNALDRLIRRTIISSDMQVEEKPLYDGRRRLTVTFEKKKVEKLKKIARIEKSYLKDILGDIVANFIKEYESKKGNLD
ncbi:MAG: hypothetical protein EPO28_01875 [Saprospiraceae bacterium]|nr:MAG: hypothetical protein EPO28_01875 [Saprospiraceae bacterium]